MFVFRKILRAYYMNYPKAYNSQIKRKSPNFTDALSYNFGRVQNTFLENAQCFQLSQLITITAQLLSKLDVMRICQN